MKATQAVEVKAKERTTEFTSENGNEYTFQKVKPSKWLQILDKADQGGQRNRTVLYGEVLANVVVIPSGLKIDDFDAEDKGGTAELDEVVTAATRFQQSK